MIPRFVEWTGGELCTVPWNTPKFPMEAVLENCCPQTSILCVTSPNNPTGFVLNSEGLTHLSDQLPGCLLMVDEAYGEFAEEPLTPVALGLPNALVFRTFSKAYGLAGLRVGYVMGPEPLIATLRRAGVPYPVSTPSLQVAEAVLNDTSTVETRVRRSRTSRERLEGVLQGLGLQVETSHGNFVFARGLDGAWWRDGFAALKMGIRAWPNDPELGNAIRISTTGCPMEAERVEHAARTLAEPEALLFDMDGVLVDVSRSYRTAILQTVASFVIAAQNIKA